MITTRGDAYPPRSSFFMFSVQTFLGVLHLTPPLLPPAHPSKPDKMRLADFGLAAKIPRGHAGVNGARGTLVRILISMTGVDC